jgi:hypothetical protein
MLEGYLVGLHRLKGLITLIVFVEMLEGFKVGKLGWRLL